MNAVSTTTERRVPGTMRIRTFDLGVTAVVVVLLEACEFAALTQVAGYPERVRHQALREGAMSVPGVTLVARDDVELVVRKPTEVVGDGCFAPAGTRAVTLGADRRWGPAARLEDLGAGTTSRRVSSLDPMATCAIGTEGYLGEVDDWAIRPEPDLRNH